MIRRTGITSLMAVALIALTASSPVKAGLLPVQVTVQPEAGNFRWTYSVVLPTDMKLQAGDYFTVYDFKGYVAGSGGVSSAFPDSDAASAANWTFSTSKSGPTPALLSPNDDPNVDNLTWMYSGPTIDTTVDGLNTKVTLGNFIATSLFKDSTTGHFTGTTSNGGDRDNNIVDTRTPTGTPTIPEPATLALLGIGLPLVGGARFFRRKKAVA